MSQKIYLSLGSNLGDRERHLNLALDQLGTEIRLNAVSSVYETDPVGVMDQPLFLNLAVAGETVLAPESLLHLVKRIETLVGRRPTFRWGPRVVDIDLLLYGSRVIKTDDLEIPHPRMTERAFIMIPLKEISPRVVHPIQRQTVARLASKVEGREGVHIYVAANRSSRH